MSKKLQGSIFAQGLLLSKLLFEIKRFVVKLLNIIQKTHCRIVIKLFDLQLLSIRVLCANW